MNWREYPNFNLEEFDSPDSPGSGALMKESFLEKLQKAREIAEVPFKITSGFRTKKHNKKVGGVENSSHLHGWAADIHCPDGHTRKKILEAVFVSGIKRVGISNNFIHLDEDPTKRESVWLYPTKKTFALVRSLFNQKEPEDI